MWKIKTPKYECFMIANILSKYLTSGCCKTVNISIWVKTYRIISSKHWWKQGFDELPYIPYLDIFYMKFYVFLYQNLLDSFKSLSDF